MGPIGYVLDSPYSPLHLERDIPTKNWRDAFEDLFAMDLGGGMISDVSRREEDAYAAKKRYDHTSEHISILNQLVQQNLQLEAMSLKMREATSKHQDKRGTEPIYNILSKLRSSHEGLLPEAHNAQVKFERRRSSSASSLKPRGQWIASLMTSGALPGWSSDTQISSKGIVMMQFKRRDAPPEFAAGVQTSELELEEIFGEGKPHRFSIAEELPQERLQTLRDGSLVVEDDPNLKFSKLMTDFKPSSSSILTQITETEPVKLSDGSVSTRVTIKNQLVDGRWVTKHFDREPGRVLEEVENARKSMELLHRTLTDSPGSPELDGYNLIQDIIQGFNESVVAGSGDEASF